MRTQSICLALAIVLVCHFAPAQLVQTNGLNDRQVPHHPLMSTNVFQGIPLELQGIPTQHSPRGEIISRLDSLRASRMQLPFSDERFNPKGIQRSVRSLRRMSSPQSQIYVIDTAVVLKLGYYYDPGYTRRHLYAFNGSGKRTSDLTQQQISGLWVDTARRTDTYDASNNNLLDLYEERSNGQWVNSVRNTYTYDASNNMLTYLNEQWTNGQLVGEYRVSDTYDANGNMLTYLEEVWMNGQWVNYQRISYAYDANGIKLTELWEDWSNGQLVIDHRDSYTYDANGNQLSFLVEDWSNGQWVNSLRWTYTYDASNNMLTFLDEQWANGQWVNSWRFAYSYDGSSNMLTSLYDQWSNGQWVGNYRESYTYDANGNRLAGLMEDWSTGQWVNARRWTWTYDSNGNELTYLFEQWTNGQWVNDLRQTYTYDANGNLGFFSCESWFSFNGSFNWWAEDDVLDLTDSAGNDYSYNGCHINLTFKLLVTGVTTEKINVPASYTLSQNYPNPFNPTTNIQFTIVNRQLTIVRVYDVLGRDVATLVNEVRQPGTYTVEFDGSNHASGVYFYRLQAGDFVATKKLILLK